MEQAFRHHIFVCTQQQLEDKLYCKEQGAREVLHELQRQVRTHDLDQTVEVSAAGCLGLCRRGPAMVVYPEGVWYAGVTVADVSEIVSSHLKAGQPVERLVLQDVEQLRKEIREEKARNRSQDAAHQEAGVLSEKLRRLAGDFQASRAFLTAVELDLFSAVGDGRNAGEAAEQMGTDLRATKMLLNALTSIGLLVKSDDVYRNGPETGRFLRRGLPDDARAAVMNRVNMWDGLSTLTACVREGGSMGYDINSGPSATQAYIAATHRIATLAAPTMVASLDLPGLKRLLDVGGGSGAYSTALLNAFEGATAEIMDLPPVIRIATRHIREAGMEQRVTLRAGNFMVDPLGADFDLILMSYVTHLINPEANKRLLGKAFQALQPGGRVVINDYVLNADKTLPRSAALYALNMLVATHGGSAYSYDEYHGWLESVGFKNVQKVKLLGPTDVVTACKE